MQWRLWKALDVPGRGTQLSPFITSGLDEGTIPRLIGWFFCFGFLLDKSSPPFFLSRKTGSSLSWPNECRGVKKSWKVPNTHIQILVKLTEKKKEAKNLLNSPDAWGLSVLSQFMHTAINQKAYQDTIIALCNTVFSAAQFWGCSHYCPLRSFEQHI